MHEIEGRISRVVFRNDENGYTVLSLQDEATGKEATAVGTLPEAYADQTLRLTGEWGNHPRFGRQFQIEEYEVRQPTTEDGIAAFLGSGLIRGVGPVSARAIVAAFGTDTLRVLDEEPERLQEAKGVGKMRAASIAESWQEHRNVSKLMMFLQGYGITAGLAVKIYKTYGPDAAQMVQRNPYRLTEIAGVGFKRADQVARALGLAHDAAVRIRAGLVHVLREQTKAGHVYLPRPELVKQAAKVLGVSEPQAEAEIGSLGAKLVLVDGEAVYLARHYEAESSVAERLRLLTMTASPIQGEVTDELLADAGQKLAISLTLEQRQAARTALINKVTVLTGGPGTGKTTAVRTVIEALDAIQALDTIQCRYALCAPTGRAAKRLAEATGREAQTIHRLLGFAPHTEERFEFYGANPLPVRFVIVDESSMLDILLADHLLEAIDLPAHVLFVGDVDQLPSVGPGNVLRDIINSGRVAVVRLNTIFRQAANSGIVVNAHRVNHGQSLICNDGYDDFFLFEEGDPARAARTVVDVVQNRIPARFGLSPDEVQVIAPMYRGDCGINALNTLLQEALNPPTPGKAERELASRVFRVGDRVMQTRNCYEKEVFTGDIGRVLVIDAESRELVVEIDGRAVVYDWCEAGELLHAYAISVHRSQGGEHTAVVVPVLKQFFVMLRRNLLYTAITRARRLVVLVGTRQAIAIAVHNDEVRRRYSGLAERLAGGVGR